LQSGRSELSQGYLLVFLPASVSNSEVEVNQEIGLSRACFDIRVIRTRDIVLLILHRNTWSGPRFWQRHAAAWLLSAHQDGARAALPSPPWVAFFH
jgi:hypothetical protein